MTTNSRPNFISRRAAWIILPVIALFGLAIVLTPVWIIQPFKPQTPRGLEISFALRRWSPLVTLGALAAALILMARLWRGSRWWRKGALVIIILPLLASTWFARQNHFEWMFNPLANTAYAKPSEAVFVGDNDMVLAVENNGEAVAYPVRLMAYHHLVPDVVGGTPIVATY
jgi:thiol:disulfide interchange protein